MEKKSIHIVITFIIIPSLITAIHYDKVDLTFTFDLNTNDQSFVLGTHTKLPQEDVEIPLDRLIAYPYIVDVSGYVWSDANFQLEIHHLMEIEHKKGEIPENSAIIMYTGWCLKYRNLDKYFGSNNLSNTSQYHHPGIHSEAITWLSAKRKISSILSDTPSIDAGQTTDFPSQSILHSENIPFFLNVDLTSYERIKRMKKPLLIALPAQIQNGSRIVPTRIVVMETTNILVSSDGYLFVFGVIFLTLVFHFVSKLLIGY
ncbi:uncharacterized protein [Clytia hemisphaerica]|uniref:Uncharacterized protein n=1 Tax=Clytia hemisphaerica TaxID=252671 RepID=A0A7M5VHC5_9CNID